MKTSSCAVVLCLTLGLVTAAYPQDKAPTAPKPADAPTKVLLRGWNDVGRRLVAMAEDFPEDMYDFKPTPAQRTFAAQLLHAANANYFFTNAALGLKPPPLDEDPKPEQYKTKAALVEFVKKAFADATKAIEQKGDQGLSDLIVDPFANQQIRVSEMAWAYLEHLGEHYGQLVVYYRVAGLVPPESRPKK